METINASYEHVMIYENKKSTPPVMTFKLLHLRYLIPEIRKLTNTVASSMPLRSPSASFMNPEAPFLLPLSLTRDLSLVALTLLIHGVTQRKLL